MNAVHTSRNNGFEEKLYAAVRSGARDVPVPPFETLASRVADSRPVEPYEQFFANPSNSTHGRRFRLSGMAWAAAAVVLLVGGAALVNAMLPDPLQTTKSAAQDAFSLRAEYSTSQNGVWEDAAAMEDAEGVKDAAPAPFPDDCAEKILSVCPAIAVPLP